MDSAASEWSFHVLTRTFTEPNAAAKWAEECRQSGESIGFIPTMGALHDGHLQLVKESVRENDRTCVSVFVNPLQFGEAQDFESYPRTLDRDAALLASAGCDVLFTGELVQFFPEMDGDPSRTDRIREVDPGPRALGLEGEHRSGHFEGVATIVSRLFELIRPTHAYFGEKDYQQTLVVEDLARALGSPEIRIVPTFRDDSGLAYSSRNARLTDEEREVATSLSRGLFTARRAWQGGERNAERLVALIRDELSSPQLSVEYVELRDPSKWERGPLVGELTTARALVAADLGAARLIDNLALDGAAPGEPAE